MGRVAYWVPAFVAAVVVAIILDAGSAAVTEVTGVVSASANAWDDRDSGNGCAPDGCVPENVLDDSTAPASRWSCKASLLPEAATQDGDVVCELTLEFDAPQIITEMSMALYKGDERIRSFSVWVDGVFATIITSSGTTLESESYELFASQASTVVLQEAGVADNGWYSITEIDFFFDDEASATDGLTLVKGITVFANAWDERDEGFGCAPSGCVAENVLDESIAPASRWSCSESLSPSRGACELTLEFETPQDIVRMGLALHRGDDRTRVIEVWVDGHLKRMITASGMTLGYESYELIAPQASAVVLRATGVEGNGWISITGVQFFAGSVTTPSPTPVATTPPTSTTSTSTESTSTTSTESTSTTSTESTSTTSTESTSTTSTESTSTTTTFTTDCPFGSIPNSLDISLGYEGHLLSLDLYVLEPGADSSVGFQTSIGNFGAISSVSRESQLTGPKSHTYLLYNGLSAEEDQILGDYAFYMGTSGGVWGVENTPYTLTARSNGEVLWTMDGLSPAPFEETDPVVVTVTEYVDDSDCTLERYGECQDSISPTGSPPCEKCPEGLFTDNGGTFCTVQTLTYRGLPEVVSDAILEDAVYGFPGFGRVNFDQDFTVGATLDPEDGGILNVSGTLDFGTFGPVDIPPSTGIFYYAYDARGEAVTEVLSGQGELDTSTGAFSAAITVLDGASRVFVIFIIQDEEDATGLNYDAPQANFEVQNNACDESYFTIALETDVEESYIDMGVFEPDTGERPVFDSGSVGYIAREQQWGLGTETYTLYNGLSTEDSAVLGDYYVRIFDEFIEVDTPYTLTYRIAGEVVRVDEGVFPIDGNIIETSAFTLEDYVSYDTC